MFEVLFAILNTIKPSRSRPGRFYTVKKGVVRYLPEGIAEDTTTEVKASSHNKEESMKLYHFIRYHQVYGEIRVLTNQPLNWEVESFEVSAQAKTVENGLYALSTGGWINHLLINRAHTKGIKFRLSIIENGAINPGPYSTREDWNQFRNQWKRTVGKANFAWANSANTFVLQFPDEGNKWGLEPLGLQSLDLPKVSKRNNEIVRASELAYYTEDSEKLDQLKEKFKIVTSEEVGVSEIAADGDTAITREFALLLTEGIEDDTVREDYAYKISNGIICRLNGRILVGPGIVDEEGVMIKGDFLAFLELPGGADMITHKTNIKRETVPTEQFMQFTAFVHEPLHESTWDSQRHTMNPAILTAEHRQRDLANMVDEIMEVLDAHEIPNWLLKDAIDAHGDDAGVLGSGRGKFGSADVLRKLNDHGITPHVSQNAMFMVFNGVTQRMGKFFSHLHRGVATGYAKAMWLPMSNALSALIVSHGFMTKIAGFKTEYDGSKAWVHPQYGLVLPDKRYEEIYPLTGGSDGDDSYGLIISRVWSSDRKISKMMRANGVIGKSHVMFDTPRKASLCAAVLRSPNGPGEFSFLEMEDITDVPWHKLSIFDVTEIDLADLPEPQGEMLKNVTVGTITPSVTYSGQDFTRANAVRQILAQQFNPGIGAAANALMAWAGVYGPSMPSTMPAPFETLVDGTQQLADPAIFNAVTTMASTTSYFAAAGLNANNLVDSYLINRFAASDRIKAEDFSYDEGPMAAFQEAYREAIKQIYDVVVSTSLQRRQEQIIIDQVIGLKFRSTTLEWAKSFNSKYSAALSKIDGQFTNKMKNVKGLRRIAMQRDKQAAIRQVIDKAIAEIRTSGGDKANLFALAVWKVVVTPDTKNGKPYGGYDRVLFQPGTTESISDLLIEGLIEIGLIEAPVVEEEIEYDVNDDIDFDDDEELDEMISFLNAMEGEEYGSC